MGRPENKTAFDPEGAGNGAGSIFGLPCGEQESAVVLIPVPWEATTSYGRGTARGPRAIREASPQLDLFDPEIAEFGLVRPWEQGIFMRTEDPQVVAWNDAACSAGLPVIREGGSGGNPVLQAAAREVDELSEQLAGWLRQQALNLIGRGKIVGIVGGDHSVSLGALQAHAQAYEHLGVLHIDAHADLRVAYEGFRYSHASIMDNVLRLIDPLERLVQVGIRDLSPAEYERTHQAGVTTYFDHGLRRRLHSGQPWADVCREIVSHLPTDVYVTFDIDGLDPALCPGTGTPVPGGLSYPQVLTLLATIVEAGKRVVGFDLVEVAPGDGQWDGNVGARVLYRLCCLAMLGRM